METQDTVQSFVDALPVLLQREGLPGDVKYLRDRIRCAIHSKGYPTATNLCLITVLECLSAFQSGHMSAEAMRACLQGVRSKTALKVRTPVR